MTRRRTRALVGLLLVAVVGLLAPAPARAQAECVTVDDGGLRFRICSPSTTVALTSATVPVSVEVTNLQSSALFGPYDVTKVEATVASTRDGQLLPDPAGAVAEGSESSLRLEWSPEIPTNGTYELRLRATGSAPSGQSGAAKTTFGLAVPPKRPADVKASWVEDKPVTITWSTKGQEPDLVLYEVQRAKQGSGAFSTITDGVVPSTTASITDRPPEGAWRYQVIAIRRGVGETEGVASAPSEAATVEVSSPPTTTAGGSPTTTAAGAGAGTGAGSTSTGAGTSGGSTVTNGSRSTVDLSNFASTLNRPRATTPTTLRRIEPPDPGFQQTLPFDVGRDEPEALPEEEPAELGADDPAALGDELVADEGERRRSLGFVAGGLLLFVLGMTGLFLKAEVRRVDELEALEPTEPTPSLDPSTIAVAMPTAEPEVDPLPASAGRLRAAARAARAERAAAIAALFADEAPTTSDDDARHLAELAAAAAADRPESARSSSGRRIRRTVAPIDAPDLDVPDPAPAPTTRTRTAANARRAPTRLPPRPADDRRKGGAAVRAGGGGTGQGDRRLPVG